MIHYEPDVVSVVTTEGNISGLQYCEKNHICRSRNRSIAVDSMRNNVEDKMLWDMW